MTNREVELLAIGAGPSNLGLAVALEELAPNLAQNTLIIDRHRTIEWQQGMLLPWAKSQVSFLKDLVTLRNPRSRFSFINHLHSTGRLDDFTNMGTFLPYRIEISEYLSWVANSLTMVRCELGLECVSIEPVRDGAGTLTGWLTTLDDGTRISSRHLALGVGRDPHIPPALADLPESRVIHSSEYRQRVAGLPRDAVHRIAVVGGSQSAAEMFRALRQDLPGAEVAWIMRGLTLTSDESNKFTNELYYPSYVDEFFGYPAQAREQVLRELRRTNYSCVTPAMLETLYGDLYLDRLTQQDNRQLITMVDITGACEAGGEAVLELTDRRTGTVTALQRDLVFLGTGFTVQMPRLVRGLADALGLDRIDVTRQYRLVVDQPSAAACYLQGVNDSTHGISDSLLSVIAFRAEQITLDMVAHRSDYAPDRGEAVPLMTS